MPRPDPFAALYETEEKEDTKSILSYAVSRNSNAEDDASDTQSIASSSYDYKSPFRHAGGQTRKADRVKPSEHSKHNQISVPSKFFTKVDKKNKRELEKLAQQEEKLTLAKQQHEADVKLAEEAEKKFKADQEARKKELEKLKKEAAQKAEEAKLAQQEAEAKLKQKAKEIKQVKESSTSATKKDDDAVDSLSDVNADEDSLYTSKKDTSAAIETPKKSTSKDLKLPKGSKSDDLAQSEADELLAEDDEVPLNKEHNSPIKTAIASEVPLTAGTDATAGTTDTELTRPDDAADAEIKDKDAPLSKTEGDVLEVPFNKDPFNRSDDKENDISDLRKASVAEAKLDEEDAKDAAKGRRKSVAEKADEKQAEKAEVAEAATLEKKLNAEDAKEPPLKKSSGGFKNPFGANSETEHHKVDKSNTRGLRRASAAEAKLDQEDARASLQGRKKSAAEIADEEQVEEKELEEAVALERTLSKSEAEQERKKSATADTSLLGKATSVFTNPFGSSGEKATTERRSSRSSKDENVRGLRRASAAEAKLDEEEAEATRSGRKKSIAEIADEDQAEAAEIEEAAALEKTLSQSEAKDDIKNLRKASAAEARLDVEDAEESAQGRRKSVAEEAEEEKAEALAEKEAADLESKLAKEDEVEDSKSTKTSKSSGITGKATPQKKKLFGLIPTSTNTTTADNASIASKPTIYDSITEANKKHDEKLRQLQNKNKLALQKIEFDYEIKIKKLKASISDIEKSISKNEESSKDEIAKANAKHESNLKKSAEQHEEDKKKFYEETETKITDKTEEVENLKTQQEETTKDLEELEKLQVESSEKLKVFETDIQKLKTEIRGEQSKLDDLQKEKDGKVLEIEKLNDEREALLVKLLEAKKKNAESGKILSNGDDGEESQKKVDSLTADIDRLTADLTKSTEESKTITASKDKLESTLNEKTIGESKEKSNKEKLSVLQERAEATDEHQTSKIADGEKELKQLKDDQVNNSTKSETTKADPTADALKEREILQKKVAEARAKREAIQKELQAASNSDFEYIERESIAEL